MARRIGDSRSYEVAPGIIVLPIHGINEKQDGWQVVVRDEYVNDFSTKREAIKYAMTLVLPTEEPHT
jgi:hypothetical protein